jgi:formate hydrogenlyase subunit 6/NADH:ubiquinone oxidoreductase subunit I
LDVNLDICTACKVCQLSCPVECISIDMERDPEDKKKRYMTRFDIDVSKCMFCGLCCDPCPSGAIHMTRTYERAFSSRDEMVSHFIKEGDRIEAAKEEK